MERKLKVLHISTEKSWRGGEQQIAYLINNLPKQEVVSIIFVLKESAFHHFLKKRNFKYITYSGKSIYQIKTIKLLNQTIKDNSIDLLHAHSSNAHTLAFLKNIIFKATKLIVSRRVDFKPKMTLFSRWKYKHNSIVKYVCVSKAIEKIMQAALNKSDKVCTVYSGVDVKKWDNQIPNSFLREKYKIKNTSKVIGTVAAIEAHKDLSTFVKVANVLKNEDYVFIIAGKGSLENEIHNQISKLNLKNIFLVGFQSNIQDYLLNYDVFLFTSKTEGLGTSLLDAMAAKVAIVTTEAGGISEIVENDMTGLTADVGNYTKLAELIKVLFENTEKKSKLTENAYSKVQEFSAKKMALNMFEIYKNIN